MSRIQIGGSGASDRPLDRPVAVRPARTSLQHHDPAAVYDPLAQQRAQLRMSQPNLAQQQQAMAAATAAAQAAMQEQNHRFQTQSQSQAPPPLVSGFGRLQQEYEPHTKPGPGPGYQPLAPPSGEKERFEVIPMNADKPAGIDMGDFLPEKMQGGQRQQNACNADQGTQCGSQVLLNQRRCKCCSSPLGGKFH